MCITITIIAVSDTIVIRSSVGCQRLIGIRFPGGSKKTNLRGPAGSGISQNVFMRLFARVASSNLAPANFPSITLLAERELWLQTNNGPLLS